MFHTKKNKKINNKLYGFTLVEVIVSVGIFALVMTISIGAVLAIVGANKKAQSMHNIINNLNLAIESMVRDMRTGYDYSCDSLGDCPSGGTSLSFQTKQILPNLQAADVVYRFIDDPNGGYITKEINNGIESRLTSEEILIDKLAFYTRGIGSEDNVQPSILVVIKGKARIGDKESDFSLQTLVSQRQLDI